MSWRVLVSRRAVKRAEGLGVLERLYRFLSDLQRRLEEDLEATLRALRGEPVVRVAGVAARRLRMGDYRVFYYLDYEERAVKGNLGGTQKESLQEGLVLFQKLSELLQSKEALPALKRGDEGLD